MAIDFTLVTVIDYNSYIDSTLNHISDNNNNNNNNRKNKNQQQGREQP